MSPRFCVRASPAREKPPGRPWTGRTSVQVRRSTRRRRWHHLPDSQSFSLSIGSCRVTVGVGDGVAQSRWVSGAAGRVTGPGRVINTSYYYSLQTPYIQTPIGLHCCSTQTHAKKLGTVRFTTIRKVPRTHEPMARGLVRANPLLQQGRGHNTPCYLLIQTLCTKFRVTANYFLLRLITT